MSEATRKRRQRQKKSGPLSFADLALLDYDPIPLMRGSNQPRDRGWPTQQYYQIPPELIDWPDVGIRLGKGVYAFDVDVEPPKASKALEAIGHKYLPGSSVRAGTRRLYVPGSRVAKVRASRFVMLFRMADEHAKVAMKMYYGLRLIEVVSILGEDQHVKLIGVDPATGKPYKIKRKLPPASKLPLLTVEERDAMLDECRVTLEAHGYTTEPPDETWRNRAT